MTTATNFPKNLDLYRLLAINAYAAYMNALAHHGPAIREQWERSDKPQPGDVVLETSTIWRWARHGQDATRAAYPEIGILLRIAEEPFPREEGELEPDDGARETVHYIRPLDGSAREHRWTNARFIRVLSSLDEAREC